jgi:hypothetical protein
VAALELLFVDADQRERRAPAGTCPLRVLAVHLNRAHTDFAIEWQQSDAVAAATEPLHVEPVTTVPAPGSAKTRSIGRRKRSSDGRSRDLSANLRQRLFQILQALRLERTHRNWSPQRTATARVAR